MNNKLFDKILEVVGGAAFLLIVLSTFTEVISRYLFNHSFNWAQEVPTYLMIVLGMIGATEAMKTDSHIRITLVLEKLPHNANVIVMQIIDAACLAFNIVIVAASKSMVAAQAMRTSMGAHINMGLVYAVLPVFLAIMSVFIVIRMVRRGKELHFRAEKRDGEGEV